MMEVCILGVRTESRHSQALETKTVAPAASQMAE